MSAITLHDGTTVGNVVLVNRGVVDYGIVEEIDNQNLSNVKVKILWGILKDHDLWVCGASIAKLTEETVANRRQQLTTELQELEAAWELAKHK